MYSPEEASCIGIYAQLYLKILLSLLLKEVLLLHTESLSLNSILHNIKIIPLKFSFCQNLSVIQSYMLEATISLHIILFASPIRSPHSVSIYWLSTVCCRCSEAREFLRPWGSFNEYGESGLIKY